ncbi:MAG: alpha/beta family hydrolase [Vicinamibacterales bacterium]
MQVPGPSGALEALLDSPQLPPNGAAADGSTRAAVVFAHPHPQQGGTMHTKAVYQGAKGLARIGCSVLRFNFRGVGASAGSFDAGPGEQADFSAALDYMSQRFPGVPLWAAGFSFGSWVALETGALDPRVSVLIGIAPPVEREGYVFEHVLTSRKPKFLMQGSLDELCPLRELRAFYARLEEPKELAVIDGADHLFTGRAGEVGEALEDLLADFNG